MIKSGYVSFSKNTEPTLLTGQGVREFDSAIIFDRPFRRTPTIAVALQRMDVINKANTRILVKTSAVTTTGFTLTLRTWGNTQIWSAGASWIAYADQ